MIINKLIRRFFNDEPGAAGGGSAPAPAPSPEASAAPADAPAEAPAAAPAADSQADPFQGLGTLLDGVGADPAAAATPAAPAPASAPAAASPAPAAAPATAPAPTAPGQFDETPPEGISERAKARWTELTERVKVVPELERRATEATQQLESVRRMVSDAGLAADEFSTVLNLGKLYKSNDPKDLQTALQQIEGLRADIATRLGTEVAGIDLLDKHPDLKLRVEGMTLSREDALEMVRLRTQNQTAQRSQQQTQEFQQFQQTVQQAAHQMDATLEQRKHLPGHEAKVAFIKAQLSDPVRLQQFVTTYEPHQWQAAVLMMYDAYSPPAAPAPVPSPTPQPLRPGHVASGARVATQPRNAGDAVADAFASIGM
ncbi:hypothetical protein [Hydrogenophaga sp.]